MAYRFTAYADLVEREVGEALRLVAEAMPSTIEAEIRSGLTPGGEVQKANSPSWAARKRKRGLGSVPLVATGELARGYVVKRTGPTTFEVRPTAKLPLYRILQSHGFNLVGAPKSTDAALRKELWLAAARIEARTRGLK